MTILKADYDPKLHTIHKGIPPFTQGIITLKSRPKKLLAVGTNAKTIKGDKASEYLTAIMYLSPHKQNSKGVNLCPKASDGCASACLYTSGRGKFSNVQTARQAKSEWFIEDRPSFLIQLHKEILRHSFNARLAGKKPAIRLNGTSDILWERYVDTSLYPEIQFYDYTKWTPEERYIAMLSDNYHLTFSRAEDTKDREVKTMMLKGNVAVVFNSSMALPTSFLGFPVFNGDKTDLRFLDPKGHVIGLVAKGDAKKDTSGFVIHQEVL